MMIDALCSILNQAKPVIAVTADVAALLVLSVKGIRKLSRHAKNPASQPREMKIPLHSAIWPRLKTLILSLLLVGLVTAWQVSQQGPLAPADVFAISFSVCTGFSIVLSAFFMEILLVLLVMVTAGAQMSAAASESAGFLVRLLSRLAR